ncbi:MAG TPA: long-chain fatty acid--CoA ligase [Acidimicrobiales bacterium]|jgi:long-chain acyl-CoA synthetase
MLNLSVFLDDSAREVPDRPALIRGDTVLTYGAVNLVANQVAGALAKAGVEPGQRVALSCPNVEYFPIAYYGILKAGAVVVPLNVLLKPREIAYHLQDSGAVAYLCFGGTPELPLGAMGYEGFTQAETCKIFVLLPADLAAPSPIEGVPTALEFLAGQPAEFDTVATSAEDTAVILYTSGTTGQPKGAELTHVNMVLNARLSDIIFPTTGVDTHLITLPLFHSFGQTVQLNAGFYNGSTLVLLPRFTPDEALRLMAQHDVTVFCGVPTMYWAMLGADTSGLDLDKIAARLRVAISGGSAMPLEILRKFEERFGVRIIEGYGLSETSPVATFNRLDRPTKPGSVGLPVWGVSVRVADDKDNDVPEGEQGEILVRGHNVMKGYLGRPEATAEALRGGWFHTGDVGQFDEDGYLFITDRVKDMIVRGGFNVYPREVEEVLMTHPAVSLVAVLGVPHERYGEEVKAFVVRNLGSSIEAAELVAWAKTQMADYKYPRLIEFLDELPMTATGKVLKRELRD